MLIRCNLFACCLLTSRALCLLPLTPLSCAPACHARPDQVEFEVSTTCIGSVAYTIVGNTTQAPAFQTRPYAALKVDGNSGERGGEG